MKKSLFFIILCSLTIKVFSQTPIVVADMSFKPNGSEQEELYYSFAEGDIIVVDLEVVKGKNIKWLASPIKQQKLSSLLPQKIYEK